MLQKVKTYLGLGPTAASLFIQASERRTQFTPDLMWLSEKETHLLFVADEMKKGFPGNEMLEGAELICTAITKREDYVLWTKHYKNSPKTSALMVEASPRDPTDRFEYPLRPKPLRVRGQLYNVPTERLFDLDVKMANGIYSERSRTQIQLPWSSEKWSKLRGMWVPSDVPTYIRAAIYTSPEAVVDDEPNGSLRLAKRFIPGERDYNLKHVNPCPYYELTRYDLNGVETNKI